MTPAPFDREAIRQKAEVVLASRGITHDQASHILARHLLETISALDAADVSEAELMDDLLTVSKERAALREEVAHHSQNAATLALDLNAADAEIAELKDGLFESRTYAVDLRNHLHEALACGAGGQIKALRAENERLWKALGRIERGESETPGLAGNMYGHAMAIAHEALQPPAPSAPGETT